MHTMSQVEQTRFETTILYFDIDLSTPLVEGEKVVVAGKLNREVIVG